MRRVLVANRGEIAVRVIRACRQLGLEAVAVYSEADRWAPHVALADAAVCLGPAAPAESYLSIEKILDAARATGADAVHPGYGFLAERAEFAAAVEAAGLAFVGPTAENMAALGDKVAARRLAARCGVPLLPGVELGAGAGGALTGAPTEPPAPWGGPGSPPRSGGEGIATEQHGGGAPMAPRPSPGAATDSRPVGRGALMEPPPPTGRTGRLEAQGAEIGYPLLVKAAAGGGGRGMRRVDEPAGLAAAINSARQEAEAAFGDGTLYLERYLPTARHVEVQLLGDAHGALVHLGERECSIQRRHQKLIEESPSPAVTPPLRCDLTEAALTLARAARYRSTGTVEFLLDDAGRFYFLEVNTRLQVEHPVTEWVTGLDLVALQFRVAAGEPLPLTQRDVTLRGHAIECRLVAEDPAAGFLPAAGQVLHLEWPSGPGVRVDAGITPGSVVGFDYDSLFAKLSTWGETREAARLRMVGALRDTVLLGLPTVRDLHLALLEDPAFVAGDTHVRFLDERYGAWRPPIPTHLPAMLAAAAVARAGATGRGAATGGAAAPGAALPSPWQTLGPFRLGEGR